MFGWQRLPLVGQCLAAPQVWAENLVGKGLGQPPPAPVAPPGSVNGVGSGLVWWTGFAQEMIKLFNRTYQAQLHGRVPDSRGQNLCIAPFASA